MRKAAEEIGEKQVPDQDVDHDWTARFFAEVQDVSSEKMQQIWAKILAGEVETPGRTAMQTLSILRKMPQRDAELFERVAPFIIDDFVLQDGSTTKISGFPSDSDFLQLSHHNLMHPGADLSSSFEGRSEYHLLDHDKDSARHMNTGRMTVQRPAAIHPNALQVLRPRVARLLNRKSGERRKWIVLPNRSFVFT